MKPSLLEKQLGLWDVYALATGATLSSGFFLLPGLAAAGAGPAMPLSYLLGALILLPGLFSLVELATAMPRAGGIYYCLDRSMGPLIGTIGGFGTWIGVVLKCAFALIGMVLMMPQLQNPRAPTRRNQNAHLVTVRRTGGIAMTVARHVLKSVNTGAASRIRKGAIGRR